MSTQSFTVDPGARIVLRDMGISETNVLRRAELPLDLYSQPDATLSTDEYFRLWSAMEAESNDPVFPLTLNRALSAEVFMPPVFAVLCSPNLAVAARRLSQYKRLICPMALAVEDTARGLAVTFRWLDARVVPPPSLVAFELGFLLTLARMGTRERSLYLARAESPVPLDPSGPYTEFFGVRPVAGEHVKVVFHHADAERPFLTANEGMWRVFEPSLRQRLAELDAQATTADRVRAVLLEALPGGHHAMPAVAKRLGLSSRTLQRRLKTDGVSFQELLRETREDLARHYLQRTDLQTAEIGFLLGFDEPNSFYRAFRDWTGLTPETLRRAAASA